MGGAELSDLQKVLHREKEGLELHTKISNEKPILHLQCRDNLEGDHKFYERLGG